MQQKKNKEKSTSEILIDAMPRSENWRSNIFVGTVSSGSITRLISTHTHTHTNPPNSVTIFHSRHYQMIYLWINEVAKIVR